MELESWVSEKPTRIAPKKVFPKEPARIFPMKMVSPIQEARTDMKLGRVV
jgi:hypothetical protein